MLERTQLSALLCQLAKPERFGGRLVARHAARRYCARPTATLARNLDKVNEISCLSIGELERFAADLAAAPERWRHLVRHDDKRVYEQIWDDGDVNAWLICWSEDSDTGFHDHDDSAAGITVARGSVREDRLTLDGPPRSRQLAAGTMFTVPPTAIHRVLHAGDGPAVTVHA